MSPNTSATPRHVVLFAFRDSACAEQVDAVVAGFGKLQDLIAGITAHVMQCFCAEMIKCTHCRKIYLELSMSVTEVTSNIKARFNYIVCLDLIVFVCILVIANRPDGLAITVGALILGIGVLIWRCTLGVKSYLASTAAKAKARQRTTAPQSGQPARSTTVPGVPGPANSRSKSWLRESD